MKTMTRRQYDNFYNEWANSTDYDLYDVYDRFSADKVRAYRWCRERFEEENGKMFAIISHNTFTFTVAWLTNEHGLRVETAQNSYCEF